MGVVEITSYLITALFGGVALFRTFNDSRKSLCSIIINIILGGTLFIILNIMGVKIPLNLITGGIVVFLGVPGVVLIILLKVIFKIF